MRFKTPKEEYIKSTKPITLDELAKKWRAKTNNPKCNFQAFAFLSRKEKWVQARKDYYQERQKISDELEMNRVVEMKELVVKDIGKYYSMLKNLSMLTYNQLVNKAIPEASPDLLVDFFMRIIDIMMLHAGASVPKEQLPSLVNAISVNLNDAQRTEIYEEVRDRWMSPDQTQDIMAKMIPIFENKNDNNGTGKK
jgi:hypothetical protein